MLGCGKCLVQRRSTDVAAATSCMMTSCFPQGIQQQRKTEAKRREKEEAASNAALRSLAAREAQQATLLTARLELESLRVLLERIGRRERIKHQGTRAPPRSPPEPGLRAGLVGLLLTSLRSVISHLGSA